MAEPVPGSAPAAAARTELWRRVRRENMGSSRDSGTEPCYACGSGCGQLEGSRRGEAERLNNLPVHVQGRCDLRGRKLTESHRAVWLVRGDQEPGTSHRASKTPVSTVAPCFI